MPPHIVSPIPVAPRRPLNLVMSQQDLFAMNATLSSKDNSQQLLLTPARSNDPVNDEYTVPAPPPPSPVSFRVDQWPSSLQR